MDPDVIDAPLRVVAVRMEEVKMEEGISNKISLFVTVNCVKPVGETEWETYYHANPPNLLSKVVLEPLAIGEQVIELEVFLPCIERLVRASALQVVIHIKGTPAITINMYIYRPNDPSVQQNKPYSPVGARRAFSFNIDQVWYEYVRSGEV